MLYKVVIYKFVNYMPLKALYIEVPTRQFLICFVTRDWAMMGGQLIFLRAASGSEKPLRPLFKSILILLGLETTPQGL